MGELLASQSAYVLQIAPKMLAHDAHQNAVTATNLFFHESFVPFDVEGRPGRFKDFSRSSRPEEAQTVDAG